MNQNQTHPMEAKILIVDDVPANLDVLRQTLESEGYEILVATSGEIALDVARDAKPHLILLDVMMEGMDGFETCRQLKASVSTQEIPVIFITAKTETEYIVKGFRLGGVDYVTKPFYEEEVLARVKTHLRISQLTKVLLETSTELASANQELMAKNQALEQEIAQRKAVTNQRNHLSNRLDRISRYEAERWGLDTIVGKSRTIRQIFQKINQLQIAGTTSVLITGESGTGKELVARAIHFESPRARGPFVPVNCSAIPGELAESVLFGHIRGAFTGATQDREGEFILADGGTLFLDEIGDMPLELQAKFLRVLEDGVVTPIGSTQGKQVDVRIVAATNTDLQQKITDHTFREDLYFRLARFGVEVPPLRARVEDIPILVEHFLKLFATEMVLATPSLSDAALEALMSYHFPGNVRELKNIIEEAIIESGGLEIQPKHLHFFHHTAPAEKEPSLEIPLNLKQAEIFLIKRALEQTNGNVSEAAKLLGTNRMRIYRKLSQEGVSG